MWSRGKKVKWYFTELPLGFWNGRESSRGRFRNALKQSSYQASSHILARSLVMMLEQLKLSDAQEMSHLFVGVSVFLAPRWHWLAGHHRCALGCFRPLVFWVGVSSQRSALLSIVFTLQTKELLIVRGSCVCIYFIFFKYSYCCLLTLKKKDWRTDGCLWRRSWWSFFFSCACSWPQTTACPA